MNSIGSVAKVGESKLKTLPSEERNVVGREYNLYCLGKTHLQIAIH